MKITEKLQCENDVITRLEAEDVKTNKSSTMERAEYKSCANTRNKKKGNDLRKTIDYTNNFDPFV